MVLLLKTILSRSSSCTSRAAASSSSIFQCLRWMSNVPENTVYGGPKPQNPDQRVTLTNLRQKHRKGEPITVVTAYDYPSAVHLNEVGIDVCLVGDSASMVVHGHDTTLPITLEEMLMHCRAVARGANRPLLVGDLPFGTYESSPCQKIVMNQPTLPKARAVQEGKVHNKDRNIAPRFQSRRPRRPTLSTLAQ